MSDLVSVHDANTARGRYRHSPSRDSMPASMQFRTVAVRARPLHQALSHRSEYSRRHIASPPG
jgi:hypothetical protein